MSDRDELIVDDFQNSSDELKADFRWLKKWRKVAGLAVILICSYNIFLVGKFIGRSYMPYDIAQSFELGLGLCFVATVIGSLVGILLGLLPLKGLPYYLKLPLTTLSGILLVNLLLAVFLSVQMLFWVLGSSPAAYWSY